MSDFRLFPGVYRLAAQRWEPSEASASDTFQPTITIATMNVWFEPHFFAERCAALLALLQAHQPDLIALQEATPALLDRVMREPWVQREYQLSDIAGGSLDPYGVLMLSRLPIHAWDLRTLPSTMGRALISARASLNGSTTTFASVHLESTSLAAPTRARQLARIFPWLSAAPHALLMGDLNFCSSSYENQQLDPAYQDVWPHIHPNDPGYTENTEVNTMRAQHAGRHRPVRFDRILLRSHAPGWQAESIQLIGTEPIDIATPHVFPSDHFGLVARLCWQP